MDENIQSSFKKQEIVDYYLEGITQSTPIFRDQRQTPHASELTLDDKPHAITNFLSRVVDIYDFKWSVGHAQNEEIFPGGLKFPDLLLKKQSVRDKLRNFVGMKGNIVFKIKINPQPYQQGVLLAYYIPNAEKIREKVSMIQASLSGKSGCPGNLEIDAQGGTLYEIDIPYVSEFNYYNLLTGQGAYGNLYFTPYLRLQSKTPNDYINVTIQAHWVDPQPEFTTGVTLRVPTQSEEQQLHNNTLDTGGSEHIAKSDLITSLQTDAIKPSTILKTSANLMQLAGYQKPNIETGVCQSHLQTNKFMANYNGEQFSHSMGLSSTNKLEHPARPTCTSDDEMSLRNVWMKSSYFKTFPWSTDNVKGDVIYHEEIYPQKYTATPIKNVLNSTFLSYATSPFTMWKGSIVLKFKIAKTLYHSGSIRISWAPGLYDNDFNGTKITAPNFDINMCYSKVIDIKKQNEFIFVVPYTATAPALWNVNPFSLQAEEIAKRNWCTGSVVIDVLTDLVANPTIVVTNIETAVRIAGGEDLEMLGVTAPNIYPFRNTVATEGENQGHRAQEAQENLRPITGALKDSYRTSAFLTGECVTSVKNFLARQGLYGDIAGVAQSSVIKVCPFDFQQPLSTTSANIVNFDFLDFFSFIYGWYAGGVNLSIYNFSNTITRYYEVRNLPGMNAYYPENFDRVAALSSADALNYDNTLARLPLATQVIKTDLEGMAHLRVPYTNRVQITPALTQEQTANLTEEGSYPAPIIYIKSPTNVGNTRVFRSAADDFQFYYLLGPPQVTLLSGSAELLPFIFPNVFMVPEKQTIVNLGNDQLKVGPFFQRDSVVFTDTTPQTVQVATQFLARYKLGADDPWSYMVCPGNETYNFHLQGGDLRIAKSGISTYAWDVLNGAFTYWEQQSSTSAFYYMTATDSDSIPIKRSTIAPRTVTRSGTTMTVPGVNGGQPMTELQSYTLDVNILMLTLPQTGDKFYPIVLAAGTTVVARVAPGITAGFYLPGYERSIFVFINTIADDIKYTPGLNPAPYTLNEAL